MRSKQWLWFPAVSAAAILQTAGGTPWPETALMGLLAFALLCLPRVEKCPNWLEGLRSLWNGVILSQVLRWASGYWPEAPVWAGGTLLVLGLWLALKGKEAMMTSGSVLGLMQLILVGAVLLAALPEVQPEKWTWQMPKGNGWLVAALLLPALEQQKKSVAPMLWALAVSLITAGTAGYYEMSRGISLFGSIRRMESLAAVGLTLGFLLLIGQLAESPRRGGSLLTAVAAGTLFLAQFQIGEIPAAVGSAAIWVLLPSLLYFFEKSGDFAAKKR